MIIEEFKSQTELNECLLWWQARLQLTDWIITARKVSKHELDNPDDQGECLMIHSRKSSGDSDFEPGGLTTGFVGKHRIKILRRGSVSP